MGGKNHLLVGFSCQTSSYVFSARTYMTQIVNVYVWWVVRGGISYQGAIRHDLAHTHPQRARRAQHSSPPLTMRITTAIYASQQQLQNRSLKFAKQPEVRRGNEEDFATRAGNAKRKNQVVCVWSKGRFVIRLGLCFFGGEYIERSSLSGVESRAFAARRTSPRQTFCSSTSIVCWVSLGGGVEKHARARCIVEKWERWW
jgi:hypothetical protein